MTNSSRWDANIILGPGMADHLLLNSGSMVGVRPSSWKKLGLCFRMTSLGFRGWVRRSRMHCAKRWLGFSRHKTKATVENGRGFLGMS